MTQLEQAVANIKDMLTFRSANALHIKEQSKSPEREAYYKGYAEAFREALHLVKQECDYHNAAPQAQASIQLVPGRLIIRVGTHFCDIRDTAVGMVAASKIMYLYATCENSDECYCIKCDAAALEALKDIENGL